MFRLIATYFRLGALNELQYRANFWINLLQSTLSLLSALAGMAVIFNHTEALAGWQPMELLALLGIYFLMAGFINTFVQPSMERFLQDIRRGTLDFVLTKPRDSQLLVSIRRVSIWSLMDVVMGAVVLTIALGRLNRGLSVPQVFGFLVVLAAGAVIVYSFWLLLATTAFWFVNVENILVVFQSMYQAGRWPVSIYPGALRIVLTFLIPVAFAVTVPAEAIVGRLSWTTLVASLTLAAAIFIAARAFWRYGVRSYSGASA
jgi:ABC-2 type transport system permease protein